MNLDQIMLIITYSLLIFGFGSSYYGEIKSNPNGFLLSILSCFMAMSIAILGANGYYYHSKNQLNPEQEVNKTQNLTDSLCEYAYFEGQKDAISNDVRIKLDSDSVYIWTKSPWNGGKKPRFIPNHQNTIISNGN